MTTISPTGFPSPDPAFGDLGLSTGIRIQNRTQAREAWQGGQNLAEALRPFKSDHLRPGEQVKVIAINRPTGYIGTVITTAAVPQNSLLDIPTDKIILRPPQPENPGRAHCHSCNPPRKIIGVGRGFVQ